MGVDTSANGYGSASDSSGFRVISAADRISLPEDTCEENPDDPECQQEDEDVNADEDVSVD